MDIGIDFGTSFCRMAVKGQVAMAPGYPPGEYLEEMDVTILPTSMGDYAFPSAFWWHPDEPDRYVFGDEAKQMAEEGKAPILFSKRALGTTQKFVLNGRLFSAREVATHILRYLKRCAECVLGQPVVRAAITHPACFLPNQVEELRTAAWHAGFEMGPGQMLMDPCAAALAYTKNDQRNPLRFLIVDLGGGALDVAVVERIGNVITMKAFEGDRLLGGCDFDRVFAQWILDQLKAKGKTIPYDESNEEHRGRRARLLQVAEAVKIRLSEQRSYKVAVPVHVDFLVDDQGQRVQFRGPINREQYAALIQGELQKTILCCHRVLAAANMTPEDLGAVPLVGGSTYGGWVVEAVNKEFGLNAEPFHPECCVAAGAALMVALDTTREFVSVLPRALFLKAERMVAIAEEGVPLPEKCELKLRRLFGGPRLGIPIFMQREEVGMLSVEDIPDEAGEGCLVVVDVEVTQSNEMRGKVLVYEPNGKKVLKEGPVLIAFPPIVIPDLTELLGMLNELSDRWKNQVLLRPAQDHGRLAGPGKMLITQIKKITEGQAPDRQVLFERVKELDRLVNPPPDDMNPPRHDFEDLLAECCTLLAAHLAAHFTQSENTALKAYGAQLDGVEDAGRVACETRSSIRWVKANKTLRKIHESMIEKALLIADSLQTPELPAISELKQMAMHEIDGLRAALRIARAARQHSDACAERWRAACEECERKIDRMESEVLKIQDDVPREQTRAMIQSFLAPSHTLRKKIGFIHDCTTVVTGCEE